MLESRLQGNPSFRFHSPRSWDGSGVTTYGEQRKSAWERLASFCLDNEVDPEDYIRTAFGSKQVFQAPTPDQLKSHVFLQRYRSGDLLQEEEKKLRYSLQSQVQTFKCESQSLRIVRPGLSDQEVWKFVLLDEGISLTSLFRYCTARQENMKDVAKRYRGAAAVQFMRHRLVYEKVWGEIIAPAFRKAAETIAVKALEEVYPGG
jgi:hypothetical protein